MSTTPTLSARAMTPSESREAALHGQRALTPILSGAISGGIVGVAWIIGIIVWLYKRHRRARRAKAAGFRSYRELPDQPKHKKKKDKDKKEEPFIIPPDPAVVEGQVRPGQRVVFEKTVDKETGKTMKHARTIPITRVEEEAQLQTAVEAGAGEDEATVGDIGGMAHAHVHGRHEDVPPGMDHIASAPAWAPPTTYPPTSNESPEVIPKAIPKAPEDYWYHLRRLSAGESQPT